jgi:hypothetical protein
MYRTELQWFRVVSDGGLWYQCYSVWHDTLKVKGACKIVSVLNTESHHEYVIWGFEVIVPHVLNLDARCMSLSFKTRPL